MKILTRADAARFLLEHDHFAILSHRRPDGDTVGSSAAPLATFFSSIPG